MGEEKTHGAVLAEIVPLENAVRTECEQVF
jgi:hypothetical protein